MKNIIALVAIVSLSSCSINPEAIQYGKDGCYACKMTLVDNRFGAEIVTNKGKVFKFDDVNCLMDHINKSRLTDAEIKYLLITDFSSPAKLIDAKNAVYLKSENIKSPMGSNVAAFESDEARRQMNTGWNGALLNWSDLIGQKYGHSH